VRRSLRHRGWERGSAVVEFALVLRPKKIINRTFHSGAPEEGAVYSAELGAAGGEHALGRAELTQQLAQRRVAQPGNQGQAQPRLAVVTVSGGHWEIAAVRRLIPGTREVRMWRGGRRSGIRRDVEHVDLSVRGHDQRVGCAFENTEYHQQAIAFGRQLRRRQTGVIVLVLKAPGADAAVKR